jgi:hypothetical protein
VTGKLSEMMMLVEKAAIVGDGDAELLAQSRTTIVRIPKGVASELFGGWGVRI